MMSLNASDGVMTSLNSSSLDPACVVTGAVFYVTRFLLLSPLCVSILLHAVHRRRRRRSSDATSHSDVITFHLVAMEISWTLGSLLFCVGAYLRVQRVEPVGVFLLSVSYFGQSSFHVLTCAERYLAAVHPLTYRGLRTAGGVRVRNGAIAWAWALSLLGSVVVNADRTWGVVTLLGLASFSLGAVSFCSLSVLCVLLRSGPGKGGGDRERVDQSKQRAFFTITAILGAILLWFVTFLAVTGAAAVHPMDEATHCVAEAAAFWFNLPSSLVAPLLFLHRKGKLGCGRRKRASHN